jgi:hypothetical protein
MPELRRSFLPVCFVLLLPACAGLVAGPAVESASTVAVPRDSAWARARRAFTAEGLTTDVVDSLRGNLTGLRYPKATAPVTAVEACRIQVNLAMSPEESGTELSWNTRWVAPETLAQTPAKCDEERVAVLSRIESTIAPTPTP